MAFLPRPLPGLKGVEYYVEAIDRRLLGKQTPEYGAPVLPEKDVCLESRALGTSAAGRRTHDRPDSRGPEPRPTRLRRARHREGDPRERGDRSPGGGGPVVLGVLGGRGGRERGGGGAVGRRARRQGTARGRRAAGREGMSTLAIVGVGAAVAAARRSSS